MFHYAQFKIYNLLSKNVWPVYTNMHHFPVYLGTTNTRKIACTTTPCFYSAREWTQNLLHARKPFYQLNYVLIYKIKFLDTNSFPVNLSFVKDFRILREVPGSVSQSTV